MLRATANDRDYKRFFKEKDNTATKEKEVGRQKEKAASKQSHDILLEQSILKSCLLVLFINDVKEQVLVT